MLSKRLRVPPATPSRVLDPEEQQILSGYQALVFSGKFAALHRVAKP